MTVAREVWTSMLSLPITFSKCPTIEPWFLVGLLLPNHLPRSVKEPE